MDEVDVCSEVRWLCIINERFCSVGGIVSYVIFIYEK